MNITTPQWYRDAKQRGDSPDALRTLVRRFCTETLGAQAENLESVVNVTLAMYEYDPRA